MTDERAGNVSPPQPEPEASLPDSGEVKRFASEALRALKSAQAQLGRDAEELQLETGRIETDGQQLATQQQEFAQRRRAFEADVANLKEMAAELGQQRESIEAALRQLKSSEATLTDRQGELEKERDLLAGKQEAHTRSGKALAKRERALLETESQLTGLREALESQQLELERRKQEFEERFQQLEARDGELAELRETLTAMQTQLVHDQKEVAVQRKALLRQLGGSDQPGSIPEGQQDAEDSSAQDNVAQKYRPKPASASAAQFRKLRRDAKRKAIGV